MRKEEKAVPGASFSPEDLGEPGEGPATASPRAGLVLGAMGSVLELFPSLPALAGEQDDGEALRRDWEVVGIDLWSAARHSVRQTEPANG
jgi:hypothetical protein